MLKRIFDLFFSLIGLVIMSPILIPIIIAIWLQDFHSPFYIAMRVGKGGRLFRMVKLRSMVVNADKSGIDSTSSRDPRITPIGHFIRKFKLDEFSQLWNVLVGDMSLVGPRPQVPRDVAIYTEVERKLLTVKPGITDIASIVFSDEGDILKESKNPDLDYNQLIRPWKSRLGLLYIDNMSFLLDIKLILLTILAIFSRRHALKLLHKIVAKLGANEKIQQIVLREEKLVPYPPPGSDKIVTER